MKEIDSLTNAIENASKVATNPIFTTIIDKISGFKISQWTAEGEVRKKIIHNEYEKAKENGIIGMQYIEKIRHSKNLIETAVKCSKYIDQDKSNEIKIDNDFFWNTIEHAKTISNEEMQELIAKILAGEYNQPGTYQMSTLQTIKLLGKTELELLEKICSFCVNTIQIPKEVFNLPEGIRHILSPLGIHFRNLQELQNLGLFFPNDMVSKIENPVNVNVDISYFDKQLSFKPKNKTNNKITLPSYYELSKTGQQIIKHLKPQYLEEYFNWLKKNYKIHNYELLEI